MPTRAGPSRVAQSAETIVCVLDPYAGLRSANDTVRRNLPPTGRSPNPPQLPGQYTMPGQVPLPVPVMPTTPTGDTLGAAGSAAARATQICPPGQVPMRVDQQQIGQFARSVHQSR